MVSIFFSILAPVFVLVLIGYLVGPRLGLEARTLSRFAYYLVTPAFIFSVFSTAQIALQLALRMGLYMVAVTLAGVGISLLIARFFRAPPKMVAAYVLLAAFGNVGNFGLPIIQFKLGDGALVAASFYFLIGSTLGFMVGVTAATWHKGTRLGAVAAACKTPAILAVLPAFLFNWFDIPVPLFLARSTALLAGALIPTMLITLGVQLAGMGLPRFDRDVTVASMVRLVAGPLLAFALAAPFALSGIERGAGILQASMPTAVLAALIALEHDLLPDFVTTTVLFSTLVSAITLTAVLAVV